MLGEDQEVLWDMVTDMGPEHSRLQIYDTGDQQTVAFTADGMEYCGRCSRSTNVSGHPRRP
jgi:hypothetical protein